jgi:hypothetical protein
MPGLPLPAPIKVVPLAGSDLELLGPWGNQNVGSLSVTSNLGYDNPFC